MMNLFSIFTFLVAHDVVNHLVEQRIVTFLVEIAHWSLDVEHIGEKLIFFK
jgi:hypothetical protein